MRRHSPCALILAVLAAAPALAQQQAGVPSNERVQEVLDAEVLQLLATLPVQEGGRVKPLDTLAQFKLLRLRGARTAYTPEPNRRKLKPIEWLAHCLFYPELAKTYEVFLVTDSEVLDRLGLAHDEKRKRDRYSYEQLFPVPEGQAQPPSRFQLFKQFEKLRGTERKDLDRVQGQLVDLHNNVLEFELLTSFLDFGRYDLNTQVHPMVNALFEGKDRVWFSEVLAKGPKTVQLVQQLQSGNLPPDIAPLRESALASFKELIRVISGLGLRSSGLALLPPVEPDHETWSTPDMVGRVAFDLPAHVHDEEILLLSQWEELVNVRDDPAAFKGALKALHAEVVRQAEARGEYSKISAEVAFYRWDFFYRALLCFVFAFVAIALTWLSRPGSMGDKIGFITTSSLTGIGLGLCTAGIVFRCVLRDRPPVSTLYETILFITACAVLTTLILEWINRQRVGLALAPVIGSLGMFLAMRYEEVDKQDTMPSLVAVLDTNFWLATHVTSVTLGYAAGLLAGFMGHAYLVGRMFNADRAWLRSVARMTYGVLCFGLLFSIVGTILGGVWANDSWGRFWGWDPKENGALMIVLWELAILHGRMGGYLRDWGVAFAAAIGTVVVGFSWWGVNLLGVGLHSYGFTQSVKTALYTFYGVEGVFLGCCAVWWLLNRPGASGGGARSDRDEPEKESDAKAAAEPASEPAAESEPADEPAAESEPADEPAAESEPADEPATTADEPATTAESEPATTAESEPATTAESEPATTAESEPDPDGAPPSGDDDPPKA